jgi:glycosyltransferase involved in cell wall biosynthesis
MVKKPSITVLMAVYNGAEWLNEAIESVLRQTWRDFEFVIVNDGSQDASLNIIDAFAAKDDRVVILSKPNSGLADSLNMGLKIARGEWIARIDADDVCEATRLHEQITYAKGHRSAVLIGSDMVEIDSRGRQTRQINYPSEDRWLRRALIWHQRFFAHSSAFVKREAIARVGGYRPRFKRSQDFDLWLRLSAVGQLHVVPRPLVRVRTHPAQVSNEDSGRRSRVDARMAITCHWIRQLGCPDPVDLDDRTFAIYREWIEGRLVQCGYWEYSKFLYDVKKAASDGALSSRILLGITALCRPRFSIQWILARICGDSLPRRLAARWVARQA